MVRARRATRVNSVNNKFRNRVRTEGDAITVHEQTRQVFEPLFHHGWLANDRCKPLPNPVYHGYYTGLWFGVLNILFGVFYRLAVPVGLQACHMRLLSAGCLAQTTLAQADHAAVKLHARALSHMSGVKMSVRKRQ